MVWPLSPKYPSGMPDPTCRRDMDEQLAEALPVLGEAALRHAVAGLPDLLTVCRSPVLQKLLLWVWVRGWDRFGHVAFGQAGPGLRIGFPEEGPDFVLAVADVELAVYVDPLTDRRGGYTVQSESIHAGPRHVALGLVDHLAKMHGKEQRRSSH